MSFQLTLSEAFDSSRKYALNKSPKAARILDLIVEKEKRGYLNMAFAYLRWIDDEVDNPDTPVNYKISFIQNQLDIINSMFAGAPVNLSKPQEFYLKYYIGFCRANNEQMLADELKNMAEAISWDARRLCSDGIFDDKTLRSYIDKMSQSLFNILQGFILPRELRSKSFIGRFTANVQILRDLFVDIQAGFINICREDLEKYNINTKNLDNNNLGNWIKNKLLEIDNILEEEIEINRELPFRLRFFTWYAHIYYLPKIYRIKIYHYNLPAIKNKKTMPKELLVYIYSVYRASELFIKEIL